MKIFCNILLFSALGLASCRKGQKSDFIEVIIDHQAPGLLWMKTTGDINADGKTDILVGGWQNGGLVAYLGPDWKKVTINDSLQIATNGEVCDIDNNKIPDVVTIVNPDENQAIVWFSGPDWEKHHIDFVIAHDVEVHDFDNDGLLDVVARYQAAFGKTGGHTLFFYNQKPLGEWTKIRREIPDGEGLKIADLNNDGKQDIVINAHWLENTGNMAEWIEHKFTDTWTWPHAYIDVADMNADGRLDILHSPAEPSENYYRISWFEAPDDPSSLWKEHIVAGSVEAIVHFIGAADFDRDGKTDIVIAEMQHGANPDEVAVFYNAGQDSWKKQVIGTTGSHSMRVFDCDGDGDMDVFGANFTDHIVRLWVNQKQK
jgi:hypothetical protein